MAKSLAEILGGRQMTGVVKTVRSGLPNYLPEVFMRPTNKVIGNKSTYLKVTGERGNSKLVQYGAPAIRVPRRDLSETGVTLLHTFESQPHNPVVLQNLMGINGDQPQEIAVNEIDRQTVEMKKKTENARLTTMYSTLRNGKIWIGADGDILFSSASAVITIDFQVPAGNQNQISGIITADWATSTTDIIGNLNLIKKKAAQGTGRELKYAFYGSSILNSILTNDKAKELINKTPMLAEKLYATGEIPNGFCDLNWVPAYRSFGLNTSGAVTDWWGATTLVMCPEPSTEWWQLQEGSMLVPRSIGNVFQDAIAAVQDMDVVYGNFGYAVVGHNPPTLEQFVGDTWMPVLASPNDLYIIETDVP